MMPSLKSRAHNLIKSSYFAPATVSIPSSFKVFHVLSATDILILKRKNHLKHIFVLNSIY